jgi:hypothetical protein
MPGIEQNASGDVSGWTVVRLTTFRIAHDMS